MDSSDFIRIGFVSWLLFGNPMRLDLEVSPIADCFRTALEVSESRHDRDHSRVNGRFCLVCSFIAKFHSKKDGLATTR
jgi:hypothetical protein